MIKEIKRTLLHVPSFLEFLTIIFMIYSIIVFEVLCIKYLLKDFYIQICGLQFMNSTQDTNYKSYYSQFMIHCPLMKIKAIKCYASVQNAIANLKSLSCYCKVHFLLDWHHNKKSKIFSFQIFCSCKIYSVVISDTYSNLCTIVS